jgi:hypothetical protein
MTLLCRIVSTGLLCALAFPVTAQNVSCSISGTIRDPDGAAVPGAEISVTSRDNGFIRKAITNHEGFFSIPDLTPATFSVTIAADGFKRQTVSGIEINSDEERSLGDIRLTLGTISQTVTVAADAVAVSLSSGEKSGGLTGAELTQIALKGRDIFDAINLLPGVVDTSASRDAPGPTSNNGIYIMGGRSNANNMTIDGVTNLDTGSNGSLHSMPSMDSVAEVKVLMSNYAAEHGRNAGGAITVITKGGGSQYHGSAGWYYKHEDLAANDFFNNRNGVPRPPYRYNIFSYTIGGPVVIPPVIKRGQQKMFFFFSQEFQHQHVSYGTKAVTVPTALERNGDFSQSRDVNGNIIKVYDPSNGGKQFPGNVIPLSRLNSVGIKVLDLFPQPNFVEPIPSRLYQDNFISAVGGAYPRRTEIIRLDDSPRANWQMYVRLSNNADQQTAPYGLWVTGGLNFPLDPIVFRQPGRGATFHSTNTITPTVFSEFIFGVSQNKLYYYPSDPNLATRTGTGILLPQRDPSINAGNLIPDMTFGGINNAANPSFSDGTPYYNSNTIFSAVENVSKVTGTHVLKAGIYFERTRKDQSANAYTRGYVKFDRDTSNPLDTNDAYSNALLGVFDSYSEATARPQGQFRFSNIEYFFQDTWKVTRRLTLDYGIRFYHDLPQYDARNQLSTFVPSLYDRGQAPVLLFPGYDANHVKVAINPLNGATYPAGLIGNYAPGYGNILDGVAIAGQNGYPSSLYSGPGLTVGPRFGFAWDPFGTGKTAIRGGGGVFFDRIQGNPTMNLLNNPPAIYTPTTYYGSFDGLLQSISSGLLAPSGSVAALSGSQKMPTVYNYSFDIQRQIGHGTIASISYAGSLARNFLYERNLNPEPLGARFLSQNPQNRDPTTTNNALPPNFLRPYIGYGDINAFEFASTSNYNSLQASLSQRLSRLSFGAAYTFSKALGTADSDTTLVDPFLNPRHRNYGPLGFDRTHVLAVRFNYSIPSPQQRQLRWVAGDWVIAGVGRVQSGGPFTPGYTLVAGTDITGSASEGARINVVDPAISSFAPPQLGTLGNAGPNILRQPGMNNWDVSMFRNIRFTERVTSQIRLESYNTLNHTQFSSLQPTARYDKNGAQIDTTFLTPNAARAPRRMQLGIRFTF